MKRKKKTQNSSEAYAPSHEELIRKKNKRSNFWALLLCLIASVAVWLYVMNMESSHVQQTFSVPVTLRGDAQMSEATGLSVIDFGTHYAKLTVSGTRSDLNNIDETTLQAYINVSTIERADVYNLNVQYDGIPNGVKIDSSEPAILSVYTDWIQTREIPLQLKTYQAIKSEYSMVATPSQDVIKVTGPSLILDTISSALLKMDLGTVTTSIVKSGGEIVLSDKDGNIVTSEFLSYEAADVEVSVAVNMAKTLPIVAKSTNDRVVITPNVPTVTLYGDPGILEPMNAFEVELDVSNLQFDCDIIVTIVPPQGLTFDETTNPEVLFRLEFVKNENASE